MKTFIYNDLIKTNQKISVDVDSQPAKYAQNIPVGQYGYVGEIQKICTVKIVNSYDICICGNRSCDPLHKHYDCQFKKINAKEIHIHAINK